MIGDSSLYKYIDSKSPTEKINYSYSKYGGELFMLDYFKSRELIINNKRFENKVLLDNNSTIATELLFNKWIKNLQEKKGIDSDELNLLIKRVEVTKKIFEKYDLNFRPLDKSKFYNYRLYVLFSYILNLSYANDKKLQYLNALLKINDICISNINSIDELSKKILYNSISNEMKYIIELRNNTQQ